MNGDVRHRLCVCASPGRTSENTRDRDEGSFSSARDPHLPGPAPRPARRQARRLDGAPCPRAHQPERRGRGAARRARRARGGRRVHGRSPRCGRRPAGPGGVLARAAARGRPGHRPAAREPAPPEVGDHRAAPRADRRRVPRQGLLQPDRVHTSRRAAALADGHRHPRHGAAVHRQPRPPREPALPGTGEHDGRGRLGHRPADLHRAGWSSSPSRTWPSSRCSSCCSNGSPARPGSPVSRCWPMPPTRTSPSSTRCSCTARWRCRSSPRRCSSRDGWPTGTSEASGPHGSCWGSSR